MNEIVIEKPLGARRWAAPVLAFALGASFLSCAAEAPQDAGAPAADTAAAEKGGTPLEYAEFETSPPGATYNKRANLVQRGHLVYLKYCVGCHGKYGDGKGVASRRLITQPRDFTKGIFKFRSTDSGSLPLEEDLYRTITRGLSRVSMPAFPLMPENEKLAVIEYVKTFYPRWEEEKDERRVVPIPRAPEDLGTERRVKRGRIVYIGMQCLKCHGTDGRGTGATQKEYTDSWGHPQKAFDFTRGSLKGGDAPEDIYRTFHTGLRSIMPSFGGDTLAAVTADTVPGLAEQVGLGDEMAELEPYLADFPADGDALYSEMSDSERFDLAERNSWDLVAYILSLRTTVNTAPAVLGRPAADG